MESVSARELKNRLSHYLRAVRQGKSIEVTVRGKAVARLVPAAPSQAEGLAPEVEERMWKLVADGFLSWSGEPMRIPEPAATNRGPGLMSDLIVEDRG